MADVGFELIETLSVLSAGRAPAVTEVFSLSDVNGPPNGTSAGIDCADAIVALVGVVLADTPTAHTNIVDVVFNTNDYYFIDLPGIGRVGDVFPADLGTALDNLVAKLEALDGVSSAVGDSGTGALTITTSDPVRCSGWSAQNGAFDVSGDSTWARFRVWGLPVGATRWQRLPIEGEPGVLVVGRFADRNWIERINCAGLSRLYVELMDSDGTVKGIIAPCENEAG